MHTITFSKWRQKCNTQKQKQKSIAEAAKRNTTTTATTTRRARTTTACITPAGCLRQGVGGAGLPRECEPQGWLLQAALHSRFTLRAASSECKTTEFNYIEANEFLDGAQTQRTVNKHLITQSVRASEQERERERVRAQHISKELNDITMTLSLDTLPLLLSLRLLVLPLLLLLLLALRQHCYLRADACLEKGAEFFFFLDINSARHLTPTHPSRRRAPFRCVARANKSSMYIFFYVFVLIHLVVAVVARALASSMSLSTSPSPSSSPSPSLSPAMANCSHIGFLVHFVVVVVLVLCFCYFFPSLCLLL